VLPRIGEDAVTLRTSYASANMQAIDRAGTSALGLGRFAASLHSSLIRLDRKDGGVGESRTPDQLLRNAGAPVRRLSQMS